MKKSLITFVFLVFAIFVFAQQPNTFALQTPISFDLLLANNLSQEKNNLLAQDLTEFVQILQKHKEKSNSDQAFLQKMLRKLHERYLIHYQEFSFLDDALARGRYDCLSGTLLVAYLLDTLGYKYSVCEMNYHVYLIVHLPNQDILIESTDPYNGFVSNSAQIEAKESEYDAKYVEHQQRGAKFYASKVQIKKRINLLQLAGLQYYNKAVQEYNAKNYNAAIKDLKVANKIYDCPRNQELLELSLQVTAQLSK